MHDAAVVLQREADVRMRERDAAERLVAVTPLGRLGPQELPTRRRVEVELADRHRRACRERRRRGHAGDAAVDLDPPRVRPPRRARSERKPRDRADRRQRLAAEAERRDRRQVVGGRELRGRVPRDGERQLLALDARAVVGDADPLDAAARQIDVDLRRARIERVLEELLQRRRRPLDDLAGRDLVDELIGERADRHVSGAARGPARVHVVGQRVQRGKARIEIASDVGGGLRGGARGRRQLGRAGREPRLDQLMRHLDVALEADVPAVDDVGLVRIEGVAEHARRARGHRERVVVPLECREPRPAAEPCGLRGLVCRLHLDPADLVHRRTRHRRIERLGEELPAEAVAEHRDLLRDRRPQERADRRDPRQRIVDAHRTTHQRDAAVRSGLGGHARALVQRDHRRGETAAREPLGEVRGAFGRRKAEDGDRKHGVCWRRAQRLEWILSAGTSRLGAPRVMRAPRGPPMPALRSLPLVAARATFVAVPAPGDARAGVRHLVPSFKRPLASDAARPSRPGRPRRRGRHRRDGVGRGLRRYGLANDSIDLECALPSDNRRSVQASTPPEFSGKPQIVSPPSRIRNLMSSGGAGCPPSVVS